MKISVIIGTYHGEAYIGEQLKSLFEQTLPPEEILIGDDSEDTMTLEAVNRVRDSYPGELRLIRNPVRLGIVENFRNLAREATGEVIFFCDQDDFWLPEKIEKMTSALQDHPEKQVVVCNSEVTDVDLTPRNKRIMDQTPAFYRFTTLLEHGDWTGFRDIFMQKFIFFGHNMAMKKEMRDLFAEIPKDYPYNHDIWLAQIAGLAGKLFYLDESLTLFRQHNNNSSGAFHEKPGLLKDVTSSASHPTGEIEKTLAELTAISKIAGMEKYKSMFPSRNLEKLDEFMKYYKKRVLLHKRNLICRPPAAALLLRDYFRYGLGFRSIVRDLLVK